MPEANGTSEVKSRILIKGGTVVNDDRMLQADVYVENELIMEVGANLTVPEGTTVIDAAGRLVIPGGVDAETLFHQPFKGTRSPEDFYSGTKAALSGGTTTIVNTVAVKTGDSLLTQFDRYMEDVAKSAVCDYAFRVALPQFNPTIAREMTSLVQEKGVNAFRLSMASRGDYLTGLEDNELYDSLVQCRQLGALPVIHAENGKVISRMETRLVEKGIKGPEGHVLARSEQGEAEAVTRAILLGDTAHCPLLFSRIHSLSASQQLSEARRQGKLVFAETTAAALGSSDASGLFSPIWPIAAAHLICPPLRPDPETATGLLSCLATGDVQCVTSAHCVFRESEKAVGKDDFRLIPEGVNGVEDRLSVLWERGVVSGLLDPCQFVAVTSTNAAKLSNLYPRKGRLETGADADIVIWNPDAVRVISANQHNQNVDVNVFEGLSCHGVPEVVIAAGRVVLDTSEGLRVTQGAGRFLRLTPFAQFAYGRAKVKEQMSHNGHVAVKREPYTGPVIDLTKTGAAAGAANSGHPPYDRESGSCAAGRKDDFDKPRAEALPPGQRQIHTSVKTQQPPGGSSSAFWWN